MLNVTGPVDASSTNTIYATEVAFTCHPGYKLASLSDQGLTSLSDSGYQLTSISDSGYQLTSPSVSGYESVGVSHTAVTYVKCLDLVFSSTELVWSAAVPRCVGEEPLPASPAFSVHYLRRLQHLTLDGTLTLTLAIERTLSLVSDKNSKSFKF